MKTVPCICCASDAQAVDHVAKFGICAQCAAHFLDEITANSSDPRFLGETAERQIAWAVAATLETVLASFSKPKLDMGSAWYDAAHDFLLAERETNASYLGCNVDIYKTIEAISAKAGIASPPKPCFHCGACCSPAQLYSGLCHRCYKWQVEIHQTQSSQPFSVYLVHAKIAVATYLLREFAADRHPPISDQGEGDRSARFLARYAMWRETYAPQS